MKTFILALNDRAAPNERFLLRDLDATHLFIRPEHLERVKQEVRDFQRRNTYSVPEELLRSGQAH
jgi:hypothetical protein